MSRHPKEISYRSYLFSLNSLVYRDIRKENIGFDVRGDVKVFDFGLSKCLSPALKATDDRGREIYGYNLTPRTGAYIPCSIPEVTNVVAAVALTN
jgi:serine/threonine protein kinase